MVHYCIIFIRRVYRLQYKMPSSGGIRVRSESFSLVLFRNLISPDNGFLLKSKQVALNLGNIT